MQAVTGRLSTGSLRFAGPVSMLWSCWRNEGQGEYANANGKSERTSCDTGKKVPKEKAASWNGPFNRSRQRKI